MTDDYGTEHGQNPEQENDMAESWQADQPPVDDFADHTGEETATVSEETEIHDDAPTEEVAPRKTSIFVPITAAGGGALIIAAILYWQFGGPSASMAPPPPPPLRTATAEAPAPSGDTVDITTLRPTSTGDVAPTTGLAPIADAPAPVTMPVAVAPAPAPMPAPVVTTAPVKPVEVVAPKAPEHVAALPVSTAPVPVPTPTPASVAVPMPSNTPPATGGSVDARLNDLSNHVEDLQKSLAQATQQLNQVSNMLAANPNAGTPAVDDRLDKIERQLEQLQHHKADTVSAASSASVDEPVFTHVKTRTASASHAKAKASHAKARATTSAHFAKEPAHALWVLRAASPKEAWVAANADSPDLRRVHVGDDLPGIGRVRAIHQVGSDWVVEGSQGVVR